MNPNTPKYLVLVLICLIPAAPAQGPLPGFTRRTPAVLAVENVGPAVVNIRSLDYARRTGRNFSVFEMFEQRPQGEVDPDTGERMTDRSLGSGVIVHPDGYVVTNEHVISGADRIKVKLRDGKDLVAQLLNANRDNDIAVLKLQEPGPFPYARLGDSDKLLQGELTIALGNPFGLQNSVTDGILSATNRSVRFRGRKIFKDFLQTSALINPGNSGGPLLDVNGRVIGINVAIDNRGPGIGYAIPVNRVREVITTLLDPEITKQAWLGFDLTAGADGLTATDLDPAGVAHRAGVRKGDRVLAVGGQQVRNLFEYNVALQNYEPDQKVRVTFARDGARLTRELPFRSLPLESLVRDGQSTRVLGMRVADLTHAAASKLHIPAHLIGPVILSVADDGPAQGIGIRKGDVIIQVGRVATQTTERLLDALRYYRRRGSADIKIYREDAGEMQGTIVFDY